MKSCACTGIGLCRAAKHCRVNFWVRTLSFPTGPFYLAMKYGVPVSFVFAMKEKSRHYHFFATSPHVYAQQNSLPKRNEVLTAMVKAYLTEVETKIRRFPYQWFNYYDFWKKPSGDSGKAEG